MVSLHSGNGIGRKPNEAGYYDKLPTIPKGESADETSLLHRGGRAVDTGACWCPEAVSHTPRLKRIAPSYKPEFQAKVKHLSDNESKLDPVFYCDRPGIPRIGPPRRIIQLSNEVVFLYEDISGDPYRVIPTDGRAHRKDSNPSYYGDSVGHWEADTLVIESTNFVESTWFGEEGYFHSDAMRVTERFWRVGENLAYQVTVDDPKVLTAPWTLPVRVVRPTNEPLEESPRCVESDGPRLLNSDHHGQR